ncbi:TPA: LOW QUALITY PROTEIN: hypothetical protein N0F65_004013 [Lagenidium giganteum]|uniref:Acetyltransferase component of pyruvate dehydrogenase complex n=1 Tax=Lagenidium giganteum TaxID=4803 RepID=A0AAV2YV43_9STRA|nr:TPA: LOW QUALITY PROTEIN: hypothetical protein N0F65_004013 [Lagenidium giganteum]
MYLLRRRNVWQRVAVYDAQQRAAACRQLNLVPAARSFSSLPDHEVVGLPALSPTMETGTIAKWRKQEGELIKAGDIICEVETDKAVVDFEAQDDYYLAKILKPEGTADIQVGEPIFVTVAEEDHLAAFANFTLEGTAAAPAVEAAPVAAAAPAPTPVSTPAPAAAAAPVARASSERVFASPLAKKVARESGALLSVINGSGPHGRIIKADVEDALARGQATAQPTAEVAVAAAPAAAAPEAVPQAAAAAGYTDYPISLEAQAFAQQLAQQKLDVPHYHLSADITIDSLLSARERLNAGRAEDEKLSVNDFIVRAASLAMKKVPEVNSAWMGTFIRQYRDTNINLVVSTAAGGSVSPVISQVNSKGLDEISKNVRDIVAKANDESLAPADLVAGTFTISNVGMYDVRSLAGIVSPNQSCLLGLGAIQKKVVPNDDVNAEQIYKYAMVMSATLACDHRVIDGAVGAQWLAVFKELVEDPLKMIFCHYHTWTWTTALDHTRWREGHTTLVDAYPVGDDIITKYTVTWNHRTIDLPTRRIRMHFVDEGRADALPVVLVHGWPDLWFGWRHQIKPLAERFRVIVPGRRYCEHSQTCPSADSESCHALTDMRGFGQTSAPKGVEHYGAKNISDDFAALLDALKIEQAVFIGHDWGGSMVWRMCLYHPQRVLAVCGVCTPYFPPREQYVDIDTLIKIRPLFAYQKVLADTKATAPKLEAHTKRFLRSIFRSKHDYAGSSIRSVIDMIDGLESGTDIAYTTPSPIISEDELQHYVDVYTRSGFETNCTYYGTHLIDYNEEKGLPEEITHRALFIAAADDIVLRPSMAKDMPKYMPNLEMKLIENAGHWVLWEQKQQVTEMLLTSPEGTQPGRGSWNHRTIDLPTRGIRMHFVDEGRADALPVVLVHGWPDLWFGWRHQIKPLAERFRVIVPDMRGFGQTSAPKGVEHYGAKNISDDLAALLDALKIEQAVFIGHDWGGVMVWRMCLYHPQRVLAVCGVCTPYVPPRDQYVDIDTLIKVWPQFAYQKVLADTKTTAPMLEAHTKRFLRSIFRSKHDYAGSSIRSVLDKINGVESGSDAAYTTPSPILSEDELQHYVDIYTQTGFESNCLFYDTRLIDFNNEKGLSKEITHPALYIAAADDIVLLPSMAKDMPKYMPDLEMKLVENAGHWVLWEQNQQVTQMLLTWLAKVTESPA